MRINKPLSSILNSGAKVEVLRFLVRSKTEWNGRQVAQMVGVTPATAHKALRGLYEEGILVLKNVGKTHLYGLKKNFFNKKILEPLFQNEGIPFKNITLLIKAAASGEIGRKNIVGIGLFGSVSMGRERSASDIDLLVVVKGDPSKRPVEKLFERLGEKISGKYGNVLSPYVITVREVKRQNSQRAKLIKNIVRSYTHICGQDLMGIL